MRRRPPGADPAGRFTRLRGPRAPRLVRHSVTHRAQPPSGPVPAAAPRQLLAGPPRGRIEPRLPGVDHIQAVVFWQIFWQTARATEAGRLFVLVGVTGFEPVASAV